MTEQTLRDRRAAITDLACDVDALETLKTELNREIREAHKAGATVQQLQEWTGLSRRMIYYIVREP